MEQEARNNHKKYVLSKKDLTERTFLFYLFNQKV